MKPTDRLQRPGTAGEMVRMAREFLVRKGVDEARLEAELIVAHALGITRLQLFMTLDRPLLDAEIDRARDLFARRARREPLAYITGEREFYGRRFRVGPGVLIPRPETEGLVDRAREIARERFGSTAPRSGPRAAGEQAALARETPHARAEGNPLEASAPIDSHGDAHANGPWIADLGTGSACIAITLALEIESARVLGVDVSREALAFAERNARELGADVAFELGDGFELLERAVARAGRGFDLVVSNPPYVRTDEIATLAPEVREHEPHVALFAPAGDPDHWMREIFARARALLAPGGAVLIELARDQSQRARSLAAERGLETRLFRDLAGTERVLEAR